MKFKNIFLLVMLVVLFVSATKPEECIGYNTWTGIVHMSGVPSIETATVTFTSMIVGDNVHLINGQIEVGHIGMSSIQETFNLEPDVLIGNSLICKPIYTECYYYSRFKIQVILELKNACCSDCTPALVSVASVGC